MLSHYTVEFIIWATFVPMIVVTLGYYLEAAAILIYDIIFGINLWWMSPLSLMWYMGWINRDLLCFFRSEIYKEEMNKIEY